jgi:peptide subunit release factor 1 (eRF1)
MKNVQGAIDKIIQYLKLYRNPPPNGLAVFCGNISKEQAKADIELFSIEPPEPIKVNIYRCDSSFLLEPLQQILDIKEVYCLIVMDGREATIATLRGSHVMVEKKIRSFAHAKVRKGGQRDWINAFIRAGRQDIFAELDKIIEVDPNHFPRNVNHHDGGGGDDFIRHNKYQALKKKYLGKQ